MALFDDIPVFEDILTGRSWVTGLAIGVGALVLLPLAAQFFGRWRRLRSKGVFWPIEEQLDWSKVLANS